MLNLPRNTVARSTATAMPASTRATSLLSGCRPYFASAALRCNAPSRVIPPPNQSPSFFFQGFEKPTGLTAPEALSLANHTTPPHIKSSLQLTTCSHPSHVTCKRCDDGLLLPWPLVQPFLCLPLLSRFQMTPLCVCPEQCCTLQLLFTSYCRIRASILCCATSSPLCYSSTSTMDGLARVTVPTIRSHQCHLPFGSRACHPSDCASESCFAMTSG